MDIQTIVYYTLSLHLQEAYKAAGHKHGDFLENEQAQEQVLSLPMHPELTDEQIREVVAAVRKFINSGQRQAVYHEGDKWPCIRVTS